MMNTAIGLLLAVAGSYVLSAALISGLPKNNILRGIICTVTMMAVAGGSILVFW